VDVAGKVVELAPVQRQKHAGGRPRACNARVRAQILEVACTGAHRSTIAALVGISTRTLNRFLQECDDALEKRDRGCRLSKDEIEFCQFCLDFHKSEVAVEVALLEVVWQAAESSPRAALAFLERRWPERWARRRIVQIVAPNELDEPDDERPSRRKRAAPAADNMSAVTRELVRVEFARRGLDATVNPWARRPCAGIGSS